MMIKKVNWNGFLGRCVKNYPNESVALIYAEDPYTDNEMWHIILMKNVHKKPEHNFKLDGKECRELRKNARDLYWYYIGIIHTHLFPKDIEFNEELLQKILLPSKYDIRSSSCRDLLVTGIIVCDDKAIYDIRFHSPFGIGKVDINLGDYDVKKN